MRDKSPESKGPKKKLTDEEIEGQLKLKRTLEAYYGSFNALKQSEDPIVSNLAQEMQGDFDKFIEVLKGIIEADPKREPSIAYIQTIIPNNRWIEILTGVLEHLPHTSDDVQEGVSEELERDFDKRKKGEDVN